MMNTLRELLTRIRRSPERPRPNENVKFFTLFPRFLDSTSLVLRDSLDLVGNLHADWNLNKSSYSDLEKLTRLFGKDDEKSKNEFILFLFSSHAIFLYIQCGPIHERTDRENTAVFEQWKEKISLQKLNEFAKEIGTFIERCVNPHNGKVAVLQDERHRSDIPFLEVYSSPTKSISIRNNCILKLKTRNLQNKKLQSFKKQDRSTLQDLYSGIHHNEAERIHNSFLEGKIISDINFKSQDEKMLVQIDLIDEQINSAPREPVFSSEITQLEKLVTNYETHFRSEDVLISCFLDRYWKIGQFPANFSSVDEWSDDFIRKALRVDLNKKFFVGVCYDTIAKSGYRNENIHMAAAPVLLFSLTRCFVRVYNSICSGNLPYVAPRSINDEHSLRSRISNGNGKSNVILVKPISVKQDQLVLKATEERIVLRHAKIPLYVKIVLACIVSLLITYTITVAIHSNINSFYKFMLFIGNLSEVISGLFATSAILLLLLYKKNFDLSKELLRGPREVRSFKDLIEFLQGDRKEAIKIIASLENAKTVLHPDQACAFEHDPRGMFEINDRITIKELEDVGFMFGVNNYAEIVAVDLKNRIRKVEFSLEKKGIHISILDGSACRYVLKLETKDMTVGYNPVIAEVLNDEMV